LKIVERLINTTLGQKMELPANHQHQGSNQLIFSGGRKLL